MNTSLLDLYVDYLISSFGATTAKGLSNLFDGELSHDKITRLLASPAQTAANLWLLVKPLVRQVESEDGVLIIDDSISHKPFTDENEIICWHYDHTTGRTVKGINFITALYHCQKASLPVGVQLIAKTEHYTDPKDGKEKRRSPVGKNQYCRELIAQAVHNQIRFQYILTDVWFASAENMCFIRHEVDKHLVMPLKTNRKVALSSQDKQAGKYVKIETLSLEKDTTREIYLEGVDFPLLLVKPVFVNEDGSTGILYLVTSDTNLTYTQITTIYRKRWNVECYHKSLKQNAALEKSPTQTLTTQTNHFFASLYAYIRLETLKISTQLNHFALKSKIYLTAIRSAFEELRRLKSPLLSAEIN